MTIISPLPTYRNEKPYPFCPGCGHGSVLDTLDAALLALGLDPAEVVIVSDIGCSGLSDQYFATSAFHGLHGRAITYATGIKLARPELTVIVIMGDGGCGIGGTHLINAARRNIGITVLVLDNLNFGMTGGQHSATTPQGAITSTTPSGNPEHPLDVCGTVGVNGAGYVYRGTSFDDGLADRIVEAIRHSGFALLDIWDLCTAYFVPKNRMGKKGLEQTIDDLRLARGVLYRRPLPESAPAGDCATEARGSSPARPIPIEFASPLEGSMSVVVAGSAGAKVRSAARLFATAAIRCGLWATLRGDYPVTVKSGHSVSQLVLSREEHPAVPTTTPDALILVSDDGLAKAAGMLDRMDSGSLVVTLPQFSAVATAAQVLVIDPTAWPQRLARTQLALTLLAALAAHTGAIDIDAMRAAAVGPFEQEYRGAIEAGATLAATA